MKSSLTVWWNGAIVGTLRLDEHGDTTFVYAPDWLADPNAPALSRSLPKQAEPFDRRRTRPFFAGLLPEEAQRDAVARTLGISKGNDFAFLKALGGDVAGALTLWPEGETPPVYDGAVAREPLGDNALVDLLDALPTRPFLAGDEGLRLSLAGAQSKIPIVLVDGQVAAIFQLIVGNADAHGKNYSLLYGPDGTVLAPLYDLMCTIAYPDVAPKLAMKIAGLATIEDLKMAPWTQFAADTGLGGAFVRRRTAELGAAAINQARNVADSIAMQGFDASELGRFANIVMQRAEAVAASV